MTSAACSMELTDARARLCALLGRRGGAGAGTVVVVLSLLLVAWFVLRVTVVLVLVVVLVVAVTLLLRVFFMIKGDVLTIDRRWLLVLCVIECCSCNQSLHQRHLEMSHSLNLLSNCHFLLC